MAFWCGELVNCGAFGSAGLGIDDYPHGQS